MISTGLLVTLLEKHTCCVDDDGLCIIDVPIGINASALLQRHAAISIMKKG